MEPQEMDLDLDLRFRMARDEDLSSIVELLADDELGTQREVVGPEPESSYRQAFAAIPQDQNIVCHG